MKFRRRAAVLVAQHRAADCGCASEAAAGAAGAIVAPAPSSMAALLASHILRDGELVILILRPSLWYILLSSLWFIAIMLLLIVAAHVFDHQLPGPARDYTKLGSTLIAARLVWATLQWMGRLYVLTDMRIVSLWGVFNIEIFDCPLRKVARTRLVRSVPEQAVGVGTIEIVPQDESSPFGIWSVVAHPRQVHEQVIATLRRSKQGCLGT